jgi:hypothetical protein
VVLALSPELASAEEWWSCDVQLGATDIPTKVESVVSGDTMFVTDSTSQLRVVKNSDDTAAAYRCAA